jgi:hypothetical protein
MPNESRTSLVFDKMGCVTLSYSDFDFDFVFALLKYENPRFSNPFSLFGKMVYSKL